MAVAEHAPRSRSRSRTELARDPSDDELLWSLVRPAGTLLGGANIVMQLSRIGVGRGVAESRVDSGRLDKHPIKRARTTFTYVLVALFGTPAEREFLRSEVDRAHRQVRSRPGDPVSYSAFDPDLQLWVAACICKGMIDSATTLEPDLDRETRDRLIRVASRIGTTLQVPPEAWPADSNAFDRYWVENLQRLEVDDVTRDYLTDFLRLRWLGSVPSFLLGGLHTWISSGYLSDEFRRPLGLRWTETDQRRFDRLFATLVRIDPIFPDWLVRTGPRLYLWDFRRRQRRGKRFN